LWLRAGERQWLVHGGESKKDGSAVATRVKPRATETARQLLTHLNLTTK
jgi:hypothetical protein